MSDAHYRRGYHATGTVGTLGAAAACARLLELGVEGTAIALGLAATQASGLKAMFGTMAKPLHAGKAAANGLLAARLAAHGFSAAGDAVEAAQGLALTLGGSFDADRGLRKLGERWYIRSNLFKYHAACYETHSTIEALRGLPAEHGFRSDDVERVVVHANDLQLGMCAIETPVTGLESKFSLRHVAALALTGADTAAVDCFADDRVAVPTIVALRERVEVVSGGPPSGGTPVTVHLFDGRVFHASHDSHVPAVDLDGQYERLRDKAERLAAPVIGTAATASLLDMVASVDEITDVGDLMIQTRVER
jgi:2-methylcitrate dehydratase PrpD